MEIEAVYIFFCCKKHLTCSFVVYKDYLNSVQTMYKITIDNYKLILKKTNEYLNL